MADQRPIETDELREEATPAAASAEAARRARAVAVASPRCSAPTLYDDDDRARRAPLEASLGCGNPTAVADLNEGETVLDLGSGAGVDVLLSARRVGPAGKAYGLDMTDEMLDARARRTRARPGSRTSSS